MSKRIRARVFVHRRITYRHAQGNGDGTLMDLSMQGCRIKGASSLTCGTRLRVWLWLPDQSLPVEIEQAVVRWIQGDRCGVSFLKVQPVMLARLVQVFQLLEAAQQSVVRVMSSQPLALAGVGKCRNRHDYYECA